MPTPSHRGTITLVRARHQARPGTMPPTYRRPVVTPTAPTAGVLPAAVGSAVGPAVGRRCPQGAAATTSGGQLLIHNSKRNCHQRSYELLKSVSTLTTSTGPRYWHDQYPRAKGITGTIQVETSRRFVPGDQIPFLPTGTSTN